MVYAQDATSTQWYTWNQTIWTLAASTPPPPSSSGADGGAISPTSNGAFTPSSGGTTITSPYAAPVIDQSGNAWTLVQSSSNGLQIAVNGVVDPITANVVLLETLNGAMVQETTSGNWYSETKPNDSWIQIANPNPTPTPTTTPTPTQTPTFEDNFTTLSLHENWQAGDNWELIAPDTTLGRGGPNYNESGDQWWTNPYNPNTPISGLYSLASGDGLKLGLLPTPAANQTYINSQAGANMPFVGTLLNNYPTDYQKYGYWEITAAVHALPGFAFQADIENAQITGTWPPEIDLRISTDGSGVQTVLYDVATSSGTETWTTSSSAGFNASASHTYAWDWESNDITFYIDNAQVWQVATPQDGSYTSNPMFLYLLTGANYIGNGDPNPASLPAYALVSNVTVYASRPTPPPTPASPAVTVGTGSDALVLNISEDTYANGDGTTDANGDAAFTVSVDGKQLAGTFYATASHAAGVSQTFTFKGNWSPGAHTVAVDFLNDAWAGTASTDRNLYVNDITYDGTDTKQSATLMSTGSQSFTVTDSTSVPPTVTGGGADSLQIKVSEDYYLANAQFTVSVDGKQLGGTYTATTLHSSGNSQTFAFAGDFGSGSHTVSVKFLNDAWAGTPATDRNLYVNDIVYNGTDTKLSAALMSNGAKTFSVSGGTTPLVSETGDHGTLAKNLSQTGTYTVGGDTFVLGSGNADTVTLGTGTGQIKFVGPSSVTLTGGSGQATVTADAGSNTFVAGSGSLDVTGGAGKDAYVFHSTSGLLTLEDFSMAKGDTLTVDKSLQGSLHAASDGVGGTMLSFGTTGHGVDLHGVAAMPSSNITWA